MNETAKTVLRWIGVLPASIGGAIACGMLFNYFWARSDGDGFLSVSGSLSHDLSQCVDFGGHWIIGPWFLAWQSGVVAAAFVWCGAITAPSHRREVAFAVAGLLVMAHLAIACLVVLMGWSNEEVSRTGMLFRVLCSNVVGILTAIYTAAGVSWRGDIT